MTHHACFALCSTTVAQAARCTVARLCAATRAMLEPRDEASLLYGNSCCGLASSYSIGSSQRHGALVMKVPAHLVERLIGQVHRYIHERQPTGLHTPLHQLPLRGLAAGSCHELAATLRGAVTRQIASRNASPISRYQGRIICVAARICAVPQLPHALAARQRSHAVLH